MKVRLISASVALAILIPLLCVGGLPFTLGMLVLSILCYKEILDLKESHQKIPDFIKVAGLLSLIYLVTGNLKNGNIEIISYSKILLPMLLLLLPSVFYKNDEYSTKDALYLCGSIYLIGTLFNLIILLREMNIYILVYLLGVTILTDTFAYLIGCMIGKHKMIPSISPKKSWEGAIAGLIGGSVSALILYSNLVGELNIKIIIMTFILSVIGQLGDLVYSKIKRENNIKDFSNLMPGHGGILDRVDSLSFVVFAYVLIYFI